MKRLPCKKGMANIDDHDSEFGKVETQTEDSEHTGTLAVVTEKYTEYMKQLPQVWDPTVDAEVACARLPVLCVHRIKRDLTTIMESNPLGITVLPDPENISTIHALIVGPFDTPYEGGLFHFVMSCPANYPIQPPRVKLMTTSNGRVRFNPNLYKSGKVCLSILGTWEGPSWTPAMNLLSVLLSIQSLMNAKPYHNEPGYETQERNCGDSAKYNQIIQHETIRVAVCENIEQAQQKKSTLPEMFVSVAMNTFKQFYDYYVRTCKTYMHMDNEEMIDPFGVHRGRYAYKSIYTRLQALKTSIKQTDLDKSSNSSDMSDSSGEELPVMVQPEQV